MTTMNKLSDECLQQLSDNFGSDSKLGEIARELLAHRRASQAAPAPSDGTCAECGCAPVNADSLCATCVDERRAPAPSDGLREAARLILAQPKKPDTLTAEAFNVACGFLEGQGGGEETTNEIIEAFLKHIAGED